MSTQSAPPARRRPRWLRRAAFAAVVVVVLAVGGPFIYIHFIEGKAPAKLTLHAPPVAGNAGTAGSSAATSGTLDGTWSVTSGSQAGYRVGEVLFGQNNTAVGRTSDVTGQIVVAGTNVTTGQFTVAMGSVASDESQRDNQFRGRIMDTSKYPTATFKLTSPIALGTLPAVGVVRNASATGSLTLRGKTEPVTLSLMLERSDNLVEVQGSTSVTFANWDIPNPSFGPITTDNHGILEFLLNFTAGSGSSSAATTAPTTPTTTGSGTSGGGSGPPGGGGSGGGGGGGYGSVGNGTGSTTPLTTVPPLTLPSK